ncbi:hypothetical protein AAU57_09470 [Nonlabens sp. YIK11]|uniref:T9SS type A sorting domain-containing protein n=1 Tax=Nonlabens sp. YIK11 TaxID=1453349 RepID=UPI0006DC2F5C|nr:T9SS type A sorting domain-containing protein [Nonlabens sp. YIK11]KQC33519.1 hypothetical protein AAU57_09470 [Nonlabens sp. YIK11]
MNKITLLFFSLICLSLNAQNQLLSSVQQISDGSGGFENVYGYNYEYDSSDNLIQETALRWESSTASWIPEYQDTYEYNANRRATLLISQVYNSTSGTFVNDYRDIYTYNSKGDLVEIRSEEFVNGSYQNEFRLTASYSNNRLTSFIEYVWDGSQWVAEDRAFINYNTNGSISNLVGETLVNGVWQTDYRDTLTYNNSNQLVRKIFENWNGSSYDLDEEFDYTYDNNGNLTIEVTDFDFTESGPSNRETYIYDTNVLMSNIANPFRDKTGTEYLFEDFPYVNKILEQRYQDYDSSTMSYEDVSSKTVYDYNSTLGVESPEALASTINVYPNPTTGLLNIESTNFEIARVDVYSVLGSKVLSSNNQNVDLSNVTAGVYFVQIANKEGQLSNHKIVKN